MLYIPLAVRELLTDEEVFLLEKHGEMLQSLVLGEIEPRTENQRYFVNASKNNFENSDGASCKVWKKYSCLVSLIEENSELKKSLEMSDGELKQLEKVLFGLEKYIEILKTDLQHKGPYPWNQQILEKLSEDDTDTLKRFENAIILNESGVLNEVAFAEHSSKTGLWIALHNYKKLLKPASNLKGYTHNSNVYSSDSAHICNSCGTAIVNGYCKCSD